MFELDEFSQLLDYPHIHDLEDGLRSPLLCLGVAMDLEGWKLPLLRPFRCHRGNHHRRRHDVDTATNSLRMDPHRLHAQFPNFVSHATLMISQTNIHCFGLHGRM